MRTLPFLALAMISASGASAQDVTLRYMMWDPAQLELEQKAIAEFEDAHPGVEVETRAMPPSEYWPKLSAMAAAGDLPDVFAMSSGFVQEWAEAGNLAKLDSFAENIDLSGYYQGALEPGVVDGDRMAFPVNWVAPVLYYNRDMFDAAGVEYPQPDWSWQDFLDAAKALTTDSDGDGTIDQWGHWLYGRYAHVDTWVFRNGGRYLNEARTCLEPNEEARDTLRFLTDLVNAHGVAPKPQNMEGIRQEDVFALGMSAMWVDGSWNISEVRNVADAEMDWAIAQVPMGPDATEKTAAAYAWADMLSIAATSEKRELARDFILHMTGEGRTAGDFDAGKVPAYREIALSNAWLENGKLPPNKDLILEIGKQNVYTGFSEDWSAWRGYAAEGGSGLNGELDAVLNGRTLLDEALDDAVAYGNEVLGCE